MERMRRELDLSLKLLLLVCVSTLEALIQEYPLIHQREIKGSSALFMNILQHAVEHGHLEYTKALLRHKPQLATVPVAKSSSFDPLLHIACDKGHQEIIRELLRVQAPSICLDRNKDGNTPLHLVIRENWVDFIKRFTQACRESDNRAEVTRELI